MYCENAADDTNPDTSASSTLVQMREGSGGHRSSLRRGSTTGHIEGHMGKNGGNIYFDVGRAPPSDDDGALLPKLTAIPAPGRPVSLRGGSGQHDGVGHASSSSTTTSMPSIPRAGGADHPSVDEVAMCIPYSLSQVSLFCLFCHLDFSQSNQEQRI
jgi:hypothetical protein